MSDTVKLIIEIPKTTYEDLKQGKIYSSLCEAPQGVVEGIRDGIPLDNVKTEIEAKEMVETNIERQFYNMALGDVIEIINNIGKADKE